MKLLTLKPKRMKQLSFELTMPNVGSWNGKWTGADRKYYIIKSASDLKNLTIII